MPATNRILFSLACLFAFLPLNSFAQGLELKNAGVSAEFGPQGLLSIEDVASGVRVDLARDAWSLAIDDTILRSEDVHPTVKQSQRRRNFVRL